MILRRGLRGYRRADVERVLELQRTQLEGLAASVERLWRERESLTRELESARAEIDRLRLTERARVARAEADARATAARILAQAEEQSFEVRRATGAHLADATQRLDKLLRTREQLLDELSSLVTRAQGALDVAGARDATTPAAVPARPAPAPQRVNLLRAHDADADRLFAPAVELDVGPFDDYAALSTFERALGGLPTVRDVYIRRFDAPRALVEMTFAERRRLLRDLPRCVPYAIDVRATSDDRITLDVDALPLAAGA